MDQEEVKIQTPPEEVKQETPVPEKTEEDVNWKKFREQRELDRKAREEAEVKALAKAQEAEALKLALDAVLNKTPSQQRQDDIEDLTEDERIERKVQAAITAKEKQYEELRLQREQKEYPERLRRDFKDLEMICTQENMDYLEYHYPEVANPITHMAEGYERWAAIYRAIKKFVGNTNTKKDQAKAEKNFNKPQSMAVGGATQTGDSAPMMLDDKRKADNWKRMQQRIKGG